MLGEALDDAVKHGRVVEIVGAGDRRREIKKMIESRRRLRGRYWIF